VPRHCSVVCTEAWPHSNLICSSSQQTARHSFAHVRRESGGDTADFGCQGFFYRDICSISSVIGTSRLYRFQPNRYGFGASAVFHWVVLRGKNRREISSPMFSLLLSLKNDSRLRREPKRGGWDPHKRPWADFPPRDLVISTFEYREIGRC
jgi:hypothetical protein